MVSFPLIDARKSLFREQIGALLDGGCDLIFLETFIALDELLLALGVFKSLSHRAGGDVAGGERRKGGWSREKLLWRR